MLHLVVGVSVVTLGRRIPERSLLPRPISEAARPLEIPRVVFIATDPVVARPSGGGGGGNRQPGPIRRARGIGSDSITLRTRKPAATARGDTIPADELPAIALDARPLASGLFDQPGLPSGGVLDGHSTGSGEGGGVGEGVGTGIGSGRGPGIGPGEGGGTGGGVYRPGGAVTPPRLRTQVNPTYTPEALLRRVHGSVTLELVVTREGRPANIRVIRSLDPGGLDEQAIAATSQWQFEPGQLAGTPVDVLVTVVLDFSIR
jgi:periplasmic protein TonB